jgi:hypothetical protein
MQIVSTVCDFKDGFEGQARQFSLDGLYYDIDVCRSHGESFDEVIRPWVDRARPQRRPVMRSAVSRRRSATIRAWGLAHADELGIEVSAHGRIPAEVYDAYARTH